MTQKLQQLSDIYTGLYECFLVCVLSYST